MGTNLPFYGMHLNTRATATAYRPRNQTSAFLSPYHLQAYRRGEQHGGMAEEFIQLNKPNHSRHAMSR